MSNLIERYISEVGRYVPGKEREEIKAELRSQIHDQLEDRYGKAAGEEEIAAVLTELGNPRRMAASYGTEQYLIGPDLYPFMMNILRRGWVIVPPIVVGVNLILALVGDDAIKLGQLVLNTAFNVVQALAIFSTVVVAIFAVLQHSGEDLSELTGHDKAFDPRGLPEADDPAGIDRYEASFGVAFGVFGIIVLLYFLRVGGLTLFFNLGGNSAVNTEIIPSPPLWIVALILTTAGMVIMNLLALWRNRWTVAMLLTETALEVVGAVALYFAVILPLFGALLEMIEGMAAIPFIDRAPALFLAGSMLIALVGGLTKVVKLLLYRPGGRGAAAPTAN